MRVPSYLIAIILFVTSGIAWWGLITGWTGRSRANFRIELWQLRDEIMDDLILRERAPRKGALDLLEAVQSSIRQSEQFTIFRVISVYAFWKLAGSPVPANKLDLKPGGTDDQLEKYKVRLADICARYLFTNSLSGPLTALLPVVAVMTRLFRRERRPAEQPIMRPAKDIAQRPIRVDLQADAWANRSSADLKGLASVG
jgi:hypothetical protein